MQQNDQLFVLMICILLAYAGTMTTYASCTRVLLSWIALLGQLAALPSLHAWQGKVARGLGLLVLRLVALGSAPSCSPAT